MSEPWGYVGRAKFDADGRATAWRWVIVWPNICRIEPTCLRNYVSEKNAKAAMRRMAKRLGLVLKDDQP